MILFILGFLLYLICFIFMATHFYPEMKKDYIDTKKISPNTYGLFLKKYVSYPFSIIGNIAGIFLIAGIMTVMLPLSLILWPFVIAIEYIAINFTKNLQKFLAHPIH